MTRLVQADRQPLRELLDRHIRASDGPRLRRLLTRPRRVAQALLGRALWKARRTLVVRARIFTGQDLRVLLPDSVSEQILLYGLFDPDVCRAMLDLVRCGATVVDVGAHVGFFSVLAAGLVGPTGAVHAFEPSPAAFRLLAENLSAHRNTVAVHAALSDEPESVSLRDHGVAFMGGNSLAERSLFESRGIASVESHVQVPALQLDDYVCQHALRPDFCKIDVEGWEARVLRGMEATLAAHRPILVLELADWASREELARDLVAWLGARGYAPYEYHGWTSAPHRVLERYDYSNIVFLPSP